MDYLRGPNITAVCKERRYQVVQSFLSETIGETTKENVNLVNLIKKDTKVTRDVYIKSERLVEGDTELYLRHGNKLLPVFQGIYLPERLVKDINLIGRDCGRSSAHEYILYEQFNIAFLEEQLPPLGKMEFEEVKAKDNVVKWECGQYISYYSKDGM